MTFSDYISDIFVPLFTKVGQWFVMLYDEVGFYELFLATIALTLCFRILIVPFFGFGSSLIQSGMGRLENKRFMKQLSRQHEVNRSNIGYVAAQNRRRY